MAGSNLLLSSSFLRQQLNAFSCKLLSQRAPSQMLETTRIHLFGKVIIHLGQVTVIQFNLMAICGCSCRKVIFCQRIQIVCQRLSKIELPVTKVNGFQCKAISTKSSILDIADVPDPPLITIFIKVIFSLTQATVILFNLITIYGRRYLNSNYETIFYQRKIYTPVTV